ncbi:DnaD domain-containing protein [Staphylococcus xylosus]
MTRPGYFKLWRAITEKPIWKQSTAEHKVILIQLLVMADFKSNEWEFKGKTYQTKPGQLVTSLQSIADECGKAITVQNVRSALARFERLGFITNESTKTNRLITIVNWRVYQSDEEEGNKATNNVTNIEATKHQQSTNKEVTTKEEVKKLRSEEVKKKTKKKPPQLDMSNKDRSIGASDNYSSPPKVLAFDFFQQNGFGNLQPYIVDQINAWFDEFPNDADAIIVKAMEIALSNNAKRWNYINGILKRWYQNGVKSLSDAEALSNTQTKKPYEDEDYDNPYLKVVEEARIRGQKSSE